MPEDVFARLLESETEILETLADCLAIEHRIGLWIDPALADRRDEIARLRSKLAEDVAVGARLAEATGRVAELERAVDERDREIAALRSSGSWRVTAPARLVVELMRRLGRRP